MSHHSKLTPTIDSAYASDDDEREHDTTESEDTPRDRTFMVSSVDQTPELMSRLTVMADKFQEEVAKLTHATSPPDPIKHPGNVVINVQGAFIADDQAKTPGLETLTGQDEACSHDTRDIRLPNHKAVVSHIAVDVCRTSSPHPRRYPEHVLTGEFSCRLGAH